MRSKERYVSASEWAKAQSVSWSQGEVTTVGGTPAWNKGCRTCKLHHQLFTVSILGAAGGRKKWVVILPPDVEEKTGDSTEEESDKAHATWFTHTKTKLCARAWHEHRHRLGNWLLWGLLEGSLASLWVGSITVTCSYGNCHGHCILLPLIFYFERHVTVGYFTWCE